MRGNDDMLREIESDGAAPVASTDAPDLMAITLAQLRLATRRSPAPGRMAARGSRSAISSA